MAAIDENKNKNKIAILSVGYDRNAWGEKIHFSP